MAAVRFRLSSVFGFAVVLTALGCSGEPRTFTFDDDGSTVSAMRGEELDVKLTNVGSYTFDNPVLSSGAVRFDGVSIVPPYTPGGPTQLFRFTAAAPGGATLNIPKTGDPLAMWRTFTLTVTVC